MEPIETTQPIQNPIQTPVLNTSRRFQNLSPKNILLFLLLIIFVIGGVFYGVTKVKNSTGTDNKDDASKETQEIVNLAPYTLVYGSWTDKNSVIFAYDLSTGKEGVLAELPVNIKKVTVLDDNTLLYIAQTDVRDHGRVIAKYDLSTKKETTLLTASEGFGIDDYVISPDKKYISLWEIQVNSDSGVLLGGKSRVYTANLTNPQTKNLITDEAATEDTPVKYPRGILNNGTVFMDKFLPNSGAGWAYGMSVSNFTGTDQKDIETMTNGTYGTQPELSSDGNFFVFAGYTGKDGRTLHNGFRNALIKPNTVELLDTKNLERKLLPNLSQEDSYLAVTWGESNSLLLTIFSKQNAHSSKFIYSMSDQTKIPAIPQPTDESGTVIKQLTNTTLLIGTTDLTSATTGNLGDTYSTSYTKFLVYDEKTKMTTPLNNTSQLMQIITILPNSSFESFENVIKDTNKDLYGKQLQLRTFTIKSKLASTREKQQSVTRESHVSIDNGGTNNTGGSNNPPPSSEPRVQCKDIYGEQAKATCGGEPSLPAGCTGECWEKYESWNTCNDSFYINLPAERNCADSPLYLYTPNQQNITVQVHTPIYNTNISQTNGNFSALTQSDNSMIIKNKRVHGITFSYTPAIKKIVYPKKGIITSKAELSQNINFFAKNLGLNEKETSDLLSSAHKSITSPYAFISFFDHETSHAILPITFDPKPDVYRNIVFYIKNLDQKPNFSIQPPTFDPIKRHGFTAVEISEIVE